MQFGIFDQNDRGPSPLAEQYENRLKLIDFYDQVGFRTYHMSEHHSTPLNLTPSPSVFLAAAAQRTRRLRLGALVYILPAHHPLRLAERSACSTISAEAGSRSASDAAPLRTSCSISASIRRLRRRCMSRRTPSSGRR